MKVCDLGTPASDGDEVSAVWATTEAAAAAMVILGEDLTGNV